MKRMPSATTQAATAATMRAVKRPSSRRAHGPIQAAAAQRAATVANRDDTPATSSILSAQPSSEQKAPARERGKPPERGQEEIGHDRYHRGDPHGH
jgi:hypothetical protein